jgi:hypothetical protein
LCKRLREDA